MTEKKAFNRIENLIDAHAWSRQNNKVTITAGERICLTQERAALMRFIDGTVTEPKYKISANLNHKVEQIKAIIKSTNWIRPVHIPEPY